MLAFVAAIFIALALYAAFRLGESRASSLWVASASLAGGLRKECEGEVYWVVDASDHSACHVLREWLEIEQDKREGAEALQRLHGLRPKEPS